MTQHRVLVLLAELARGEKRTLNIPSPSYTVSVSSSDTGHPVTPVKWSNILQFLIIYQFYFNQAVSTTEQCISTTVTQSLVKILLFSPYLQNTYTEFCWCVLPHIHIQLGVRVLTSLLVTEVGLFVLTYAWYIFTKQISHTVQSAPEKKKIKKDFILIIQSK